VKTRLYGLLAEFDNPTDLVAAAHQAREAGYRRVEAYTPFPVEELTEALPIRRTWLPLVILFGGLVGGLGGYFMQYYASVIGYPLNIGGRPLHSWPAFIPVTFELTILAAAITAVLAMLGMNGLPMPYHPLFNVERFALASRNRFFLCIEAADPKYEEELTRQFLAGLHPRSVQEVPH
jgi:Protein of unknown function (DUF3341)